MKRYAFLASTVVVGGAIAFQGSVNLQGSTPGTAQSGHLHITGKAKAGVFEAISTAPTGITYGGDFRSASNQGRGVLGNASATSGATYGGLFQAASNGGRAVAGIAGSPTGTTYGGFFSSLSNQGRGVYGQATSPSGTTYGVYGTATSPNGYGVYSNGRMHATGLITGPGGRFETNEEDQNASLGISTSVSGDVAGVYGQSASNEGRGVYGNATNASGSTYGVYGRAVSAAGYGVFSEGRMHATGVISGNGSGLTSVNASTLGGLSSSAFLQAVPFPLFLSGSTPDEAFVVTNNSTSFNTSRAIAAASYAPGASTIIAFCNGDLGNAIDGRAYGNGASRGGSFQTQSSGANAAGAFGEATSTSGTTYGVWGQSASTGGYGVIGIAPAATGVTYGTYGRATSAAGWSLYAQGAFGASGTKAFRIDHPTDPENKYLLHYAAESPMPQNFYVGNVKTDANGKAWVDLPDYFSEINTNFKYQLTVVEDDATTSFVQVKVGRKIRDGRFLIMSSAPNTEVSWRVDADRNDLYVRNRPPKDVIEKVGAEKGTYQHPEFYGLGADRGMNPGTSANKKAIKPSR